MVFFGDISKAFDCLWHKGLIEKLKAYDINGKLVHWLKDYISERKQQVLLNNSISTPGTLKAGVPQGVCSGPSTIFAFYKRYCR